MESGHVLRLFKIEPSCINSGVLMWSSFWSCEKQTPHLSGFFYPNSFTGFSAPGYSLVLRDIDRVGASRMRMTVWRDPKTEQQSQAMRELSTRLLVETDPKKLDALIQKMTRIIAGNIRHGLQN